MDFERENPKLKAVLLALLAILVIAILITVYFINREASKNPSTDINLNKEQSSGVKPLTPEEIQEALSKTSESTGTAGGDTSVEALTPKEIDSALNKTSDTTAQTDVKPLTPSEIQDALNKTK